MPTGAGVPRIIFALTSRAKLVRYGVGRAQ